mmetsp:Transcript_33240/g.56882  ORF Transcript_33240/g.56882 Transcript_33240/m.56882 type:complete len:169 (-) Transcript_33240:2-508(-)
MYHVPTARMTGKGASTAMTAGGASDASDGPSIRSRLGGASELFSVASVGALWAAARTASTASSTLTIWSGVAASSMLTSLTAWGVANGGERRKLMLVAAAAAAAAAAVTNLFLFEQVRFDNAQKRDLALSAVFLQHLDRESTFVEQRKMILARDTGLPELLSNHETFR